MAAESIRGMWRRRLEAAGVAREDAMLLAAEIMGFAQGYAAQGDVARLFGVVAGGDPEDAPAAYAEAAKAVPGRRRRAEIDDATARRICERLAGGQSRAAVAAEFDMGVTRLMNLWYSRRDRFGLGNVTLTKSGVLGELVVAHICQSLAKGADRDRLAKEYGLTRQQLATVWQRNRGRFGCAEVSLSSVKRSAEAKPEPDAAATPRPRVVALPAGDPALGVKASPPLADADRAAIEAAVRDGKVTRCPTAYAAPVAGAVPVAEAVPVYDEGGSWRKRAKRAKRKSSTRG